MAATLKADLGIEAELVEDLIGGVTIDFWRKLRPWVEDLRAANRQPLLLEWFQWLAERLAERGRSDAVPVYERCRDWTPED